MIKFSSLSIVLLFAFKAGFTQSPGTKTVNQSIEWYSLNSTIKFHNHVGIYVEGNFRFAQKMEPQQNQFRTGVEFTVNKWLSIIPVGYVYTWNYKYGKQPVSFINNEHRIYQQVVVKYAYKRFFSQQRLRLEERFLQNRHLGTDGKVEGYDYNDERYRLRYRFLGYVPLNNSKIEAKTIFLSIWDEVFVSWGAKVTYHEPDQNRLFVGAGYQFTKLISMQAGGLYQMLKKSNGTLQENNFGGMLQLTYNLDLTKSAK